MFRRNRSREISEFKGFQQRERMQAKHCAQTGVRLHE
jgi:hypothetical protein